MSRSMQTPITERVRQRRITAFHAQRHQPAGQLSTAPFFSAIQPTSWLGSLFNYLHALHQK